MTAATREELLQAALRYAAVWPVFPCKPGAKVPAIPAAHGQGDPARLTCHGGCGREGHGFWDATRVRQIIEDWWARWPLANVAVPTGSQTVDVLDVDVKPDGSGWAALNVLKRAGMLAGAGAMVRTRSGGLHVYFRGSGQGCGRLPRHHLDFKSVGGYILVPPSFVEADDKGPAGSYELLDHRPGERATLDWAAVRRLLEPPRPATRAVRTDVGDLTEARRTGILRYATESNTKGGWAGALFNAGCLYARHGASLADALADIVDAAQPWNDHEARRAEMHVRNGWQRGSGQLEAVNR